MKLRSNRDLWPVRKWDLPPRWAAAREPRFESLEHNPVFRMIGFQDRNRGRNWRQILSIASTLAIAALILFYLRGSAGGFSSWMIWAIVLSSFLGQRKRTDIGILGLPTNCVGDLVQAGITAEQVALGIWGATSSIRKLIQFSLSVIVSLAIGAVVIRFAFSGVSWTIVLIFSLISSYWLVNFYYWPAGALPFVARTVRFARRAMEARLHPAREVGKRFVGFLRFTAIVALIFFAVAFNVTLVYLAVEYFDVPLPNLLSATAVNPALAILASALVGALGGWIAGTHARRRADRNFADAVADVRAILEMVARESDAQSASPRASKSMSL